MSVTPGAATKMNSLVGYARIVPVTDAEFADATISAKVFKSGTMIQKADGKVLIADGTSALSALKVRIDQTLVKTEKDALAAAFVDGGAYARAANGVVVHGADGQIDDASLKVVNGGKIVRSYLSDVVDENGKVLDSVLNMIADGKIVESYLSKYIDKGKVKLDALPDTVRAGVAYYADWTTFQNKADAETKRGLAFVIDATGDPSKEVKSGSAMYAWDETANSGAGDWIKIAEVESLDIDVESLRPTYEHLQENGAIMYDHPIMLGGMTLTQLASLDAA